MSGNTDLKLRPRMLLRSALVVPLNPDWRPHALGQGSIVSLINRSDSNFEWLLSQNPLKVNGEIPVWWINSDGHESIGWLAQNTQTSVPSITKKLHYRPFNVEDDALSTLDNIREKARLAGKSMRRWLRTIGKKVKDTEQLRFVVRELGGRTKPTDDGPTLITHLERMITHNEDRNMARNKGKKIEEQPEEELEEEEMYEDEGGEEEEIEEEEEEAPRKKSKKSAKKSGKKSKGDAEPARSAARTVGEVLLPLVKGNRDATRIAKALAGDEKVSKKQLTELRDKINELGATLREEGKAKQATALSAANRMVRRLQRSA